ERTSAIRELLTAEPPADVEDFLATMPRGYVLAVDPQAAARHFHLVLPWPGALEVRTAAEPGPRPGNHALAVRARARPGLLARIPVKVTVDNGASDFYTVIEVGAADRIGLLFDVTRTFADLDLDVHVAKVATYGDRVVDAFYVRDVLGGKVEDREAIEEIERAVTARLQD